MSKQLVCICNVVSEKEIMETLKKGARSTSDIQGFTGAGTNCGKCLVVIDSLVEEFLSQKPGDLQQRIDFENG
jgi:bacterioferritin-associated ferredoxin